MARALKPLKLTCSGISVNLPVISAFRVFNESKFFLVVFRIHATKLVHPTANAG